MMKQADATLSRGLKRTLRESFGIEHLRPGQAEVIDSVLQGQDTIAIMPTGAGKSLCYQLTGLHMEGTTVVVSPLIALMKDQAEKLDEAGLEAAQFNSTLKVAEEQAAYEALASSSAEFVFATPERLADPEFRHALSGQTIDLLVVDEAHCISRWGHDFRPHFLDIGQALEHLGRPPVLALTATATPQVVDDIVKHLGLKQPKVIDTGMYRENLHYAVEQPTNANAKRDALLNVLQRHAGHAGIVYCATVKAAEQVHALLTDANVDVALYHGRLPAKQRHEQQEAFMSGRAPLMVATNAFGMGIDKPDVRFIVHWQIPGSLEAYYQESGRAGRDGEDAECTLLFDLDDMRVQRFFLARRFADESDLAAVLGVLDARGAPVDINELRSELPRVTVARIELAARLLRDAGLVEQTGAKQFKALASAKRDAESTEHLKGIAEEYGERKDADRKQLESMIQYAQSAACRWQMLMKHFDADSEFERCRRCDNCLHPPALRLAEHAQRPMPRVRPTPIASPARFKSGDAVRIAKFGGGRVVSATLDRVEVEFPDGATRSFIDRVVEPATSESDGERDSSSTESAVAGGRQLEGT